MPKSARQRSSECILVLGAKGSGKSHWSKRFVDALDRRALVLVWDPNLEWTGAGSDKGIRGAQAFRSTRELARWVVEHNPRVEGKRLVVQHVRAPGAQDPRRLRVRSDVQDFGQLCRLAMLAGDCWLVIDEAATYCRAEVATEHTLELVRVSRHRRVNVLMIAQRPTHLHPDIRDNRDRTILFQMPGEASLAWVRAEFGFSAESSTRKLRPRSWIELSRGSPPEDGTEESEPRRRQKRRGSADRSKG